MCTNTPTIDASHKHDRHPKPESGDACDHARRNQKCKMVEADHGCPSPDRMPSPNVEEAFPSRVRERGRGADKTRKKSEPRETGRQGVCHSILPLPSTRGRLRLLVTGRSTGCGSQRPFRLPGAMAPVASCEGQLSAHSGAAAALEPFFTAFPSCVPLVCGNRRRPEL